MANKQKKKEDCHIFTRGTLAHDAQMGCFHCGDTHVICTPIDIDSFLAASNAFLDRHKKCPAPSALADIPGWPNPLILQLEMERQDRENNG